MDPSWYFQETTNLSCNGITRLSKRVTCHSAVGFCDQHTITRQSVNIVTSCRTSLISLVTISLCFLMYRIMISICWQLIAFCWCLKDIACGPKVQLLPIGFRNGRLKYFEPDRGVRIPDIPYRFPDASFFKTVTLHRLLLLNIGDKSRHFDDIAVRIYSVLSGPPRHYKTRYT